MQKRFHNHLARTCLMMAVILCVILPAACGNDITSTVPETSTTTTTTISTVTPSATTTTTVSPPPISSYNQFSTLPKAGEPVEWVFGVDIHRLTDFDVWYGGTPKGLEESRIWLSAKWAGVRSSYSEARSYSEVLIEELIIGGNASWEGNALENTNPEITCRIQLPREGIWIFNGHFSGKDWEKAVINDVVIVAADGMSMNYRNKSELVSSPLAYLEYFDYGRTQPYPTSVDHPAWMRIDITKPPLAGEEVTLTCRVTSPYVSIDDFHVRIRVIKRNRNENDTLVPSNEIFLTGEPEWFASFEKGELIEKSAVIRFPEAGEWEIDVRGNYPTNEGLSYYDEIKLTILEESSFFGWEPISVAPPLTTSTTPTSIQPTPTDFGD